jgi:aconitate hydratase
MGEFESCRQSFPLGPGGIGLLYSLQELERHGTPGISRLPVSIRIVLESLLRNCDGERVKGDDVRALAAWRPKAERTAEVPFVVARIILQDFTGVPLLVDLAAMRSAVIRLGADPRLIEPLVPVALVVDHSVQVDEWSTPDALAANMRIEFQRNRARYEFLKWGMQAFHGFEVVPPGIGIVHQVNLEYLAQGVLSKDDVYFPDSLVGTDSHTTMINGLGVVGWGVGGIEAEAGMLGQPVYFLTPDVVGVHLTGRISEGVTATDLVLAVTEMLRRAKVVGKFVEFYGDGAASLPVTDRATVANMAPEYGATMGFFPADEESCKYLLATGRSPEHVDTFRNYYTAQGLFGMPRKGDCDYTEELSLDLASVQPSVSGPKRPQDRIPLPELKSRFRDLLSRPIAENGYGKDAASLTQRFPARLGRPLPGGGSLVPVDAAASRARNTSAWTEAEMANNHPTPDRVVPSAPSAANVEVGHGDVLIAAITSCTNTSNPSVMMAAGLLAKKAVERGLSVDPRVKASLAPGSRVVTEYLAKTGLQPYLDRLGFHLVGYGCTTCIGNSGPLDSGIEEAVTKHDLVTAAVLSGNRNFEARIHQNIKANFLMSPPLVVAFALAGRVDIDLTTEPIGKARDGKAVFLRDIWPTTNEVEHALLESVDAATYRRLYADLAAANPLWKEIPSAQGTVYAWDTASTYIQQPPFFEGFGPNPAPLSDIRGARALAIFGDSVTTDHISPAGAIQPSSPAGVYLQSVGVSPADFNSYGSRRGNDRVMARGTFANVRIKNLMVPGVEGGVTRHEPDREQMAIYDAAMRYRQEGVPLMIFAGQEYGTGSSRDWAAKGTRLLGVRAVVAESYERIHRSNLVGMGVLPLQFADGTNAASLGLDGRRRWRSAAAPGR